MSEFSSFVLFLFFFLRKSERYDKDEFYLFIIKKRKLKNSYLKQAMCLYKRITNLKEKMKSVIQKWDNL